MIKHGIIKDIPISFFEGEGGSSKNHCSQLDNSSNDNHICHKVFTSLSKFYAHLRIHTNEKPFVCPVENCEMSFN